MEKLMRNSKEHEQWQRWEPLPNLAFHYYIEYMRDSLHGLEILLANTQDTTNKVYVPYDGSMSAYTISGQLGIPTPNSQPLLNTKFIDWTFFQITNSLYIQHLIKQSYTLIEQYDPQHFLFYGVNAKIDVITSYKPKMRALTYNLETITLLYKEVIFAYIFRYIPNAKIILCGPIDIYNPAITIGLKANNLNNTLLDNIQSDLTNSIIPLPCTVVDLQQAPNELLEQMLKNHVIWKD